MTLEHVLWIVAVWVATTAVTLLIAATVLTTIPATYLRDDDTARRASGHARWGLRIARNLIGLLLVVVGVALSVPGVPGQGVLVVVAGLVLMDLPGRRWLLLKLLGRRSTLSAINRVRAWLGRRPLLPADAAPQKTRGPVAMPDATRRRVR